MYRELVMQRELERLRREQTRRERPFLQLPIPVPYWSERDEEGREEETSRGVVIIDMEDYSEVDD